MTTLDDEFLVAIEGHAVDHLRRLLDEGLDPRLPIRGKTPTRWLTEMYTRSDRFPECLDLLLTRGGALDDPILAPVLLNDAEGVRSAARSHHSLVTHRTSMRSAFTPLEGASLLHVAAEYGHPEAARALIELGADIEARADVDVHGLGGHTPIFHTVNSNGNRSLPVLRLLLAAGSRTDRLLPGLTWGRGFEWETTLFDVTPLSYAQCGLLPQMHRREADIQDTLQLLLEAAGRSVPPRVNVPNRYLERS